jgi:hypothetical protein
MTILIDNFSMDVSEWKLVSELVSFSVDIIDHNYSISTSGTYFVHDNIIVSTVLSGISDGYRAYYFPLSISTSGTTYITLHAENSNSEIEEQTYELLHGYHVEFKEVIDWGPIATVITTATAANTVFCPNDVGVSAYFETKDLESYDLSATIGSVESVNLGAIIYPQNTFFFYGRTYTITIIGVKDFSGNIMDTYELSFTIENPNN